MCSKRNFIANQIRILEEFHLSHEELIAETNMNLEGQKGLRKTEKITQVDTKT